MSGTVVIDNYDSFTWNLVQMLGEMDADIQVVRNDVCSVADIAALKPDRIMISPGPGRPEDAGISEAVIETLGKTIPILGVCLGHQAICETAGARIVSAKQLMHGKSSQLDIVKEDPLFVGLEEPVQVGRYHSLAAVDIPETLDVLALAEDGEVMAVKHKDYPVWGVQFHPESILTPQGKQLLGNFLKERAEQK